MRLHFGTNSQDRRFLTARTARAADTADDNVSRMALRQAGGTFSGKQRTNPTEVASSETTRRLASTSGTTPTSRTVALRTGLISAPRQSWLTSALTQSRRRRCVACRSSIAHNHACTHIPTDGPSLMAITPHSCVPSPT